MLQQLLAELSKGGTVDVAQLAARLKTSPAMVRAMLEQLQSMGRLEPFSACSTGGCESCGISSTCGQVDKNTRVWQVKTPRS
jgi:DeoR/GlpR family transcriptional regulator of sugar metabolism